MAKLISYGDDAVLIGFDAPQDIRTTQHIHAVVQRLGALNIFTEIVPGYDSLLVQFNPLKTTKPNALDHIQKALQAPSSQSQSQTPAIDVPICYEGEYGLDMDAACEYLKLSRAEIISLHSTPIYTVCMLGFIPGFTFLSAADKRLHMPRHSKPRARVPAGSVGIANWQTGIYALESPGGWKILGRTPYVLFDPKSDTPFRFKAGDRLRFNPISLAEFNTL